MTEHDPAGETPASTGDPATAAGTTRGHESVEVVLHRLAVEGLPARLTGTGGGHGAIEVTLETGQHLLITDAEDALSSDRDRQRGWGVGLYRAGSEYDDGPLRFESTEDDATDVPALLGAIRAVLRPE